MRKIILSFAIASFIIVLLVYFLSFNKQLPVNIVLVEPNKSYIDEFKKAESEINKLQNSYIFINLPNKSERVNIKDIGVEVNLAFIEEYKNNCNSQICGETAEEILSKLATDVIKINDKKTGEFIENTNNKVTNLLVTPDISFNSLTFKAYDPTASIVLDKENLVQQLEPAYLIKNKEIKLSTIVENNNTLEQEILTKSLGESSAKESLLIKYGRQPVYINPDSLSKFIEYQKHQEGTVGKVSLDEIEKYLNELQERHSIEVTLEKEKAKLAIAYALLFRISGEPFQTAVILPIKGESKTKGSYADAGKYIEINKSQQRMYTFDKGKLVDTYIVGTGLTWETPAGEFKILRKEGTAISYFGNWYMPYYMPIGIVNEKYFFGFHEVPYKINTEGQISSRDLNTMGSPATGGCIQLYREDAKEIYEWADIGTPVIIYE